MELSPNILLYGHMYLQVSSPLIHRNTNCSLALLTSICYISSSSSECSPPPRSNVLLPLDHPTSSACHLPASSAPISNLNRSRPLPPALLQVFPLLLSFHRTLVAKQQHLHQLILVPHSMSGFYMPQSWPPLEFFFQEQSYSSLHSGQSLAWDHVRGDIDDPCGAIADFCGVIADF